MIPLGEGPVPDTGEAMSLRIESGTRDFLALGSESPIDVNVLLDSANVAMLRIDVTGAVAGSVPSKPGLTRAATEPFPLRNFEFAAAPVFVSGLSVRLQAELDELGVQWSRTADGGLWLTAVDSTAVRTTGIVDVSVSKSDVELFARGALEKALGKFGSTVESFHISVSTSGEKTLAVAATALVAMMFMTAEVNASAVVEVDDDFTVRLSGISLSSPNPVANALLPAVGAKFLDWEGREYRIGDLLFAGIGLTSIAVSAGELIEARARLGQ